MASIRLRSTSSSPCSIHAQHLSASCATARVMRPCARTSREIARAAQQAIGDARRPAAAARDFYRAIVVHRNVQNLRGAIHNLDQIFRLVKIQPVHDAEARAQRRGNQAGARGRSDQREVVQLKRMDARARPLPDDQIDAVILHRGIEDFFDRGLQAMNLVEKKNFLRFERSQNRGQIAFAFEQRARTGLDR